MLTEPIPGVAVVRTEDQEAEALAGLLLMYQRMGRIQLYSHIPHETYTKSWAAKMKNKRQGVRTGVPDYIIVTKNKVIFIELKRTKGGTLSTEQKQWLIGLEGKTTTAVRCNGFEEARLFINKELGIPSA